jgi:hypothetical protein
MADKLQTDNIDVALAQIAWQLTPNVDWFKHQGQAQAIDQYKRQAEHFAAVFNGLRALAKKSQEQLSGEVIADAFKWQG